MTVNPGTILYRDISKPYRSTCAVDKNGSNQSLSGEGWTELTATRKLWDVNEDYDLDSNDFICPVDSSLYVLESQILVQSCVNVLFAELAVFKRGSPDDYWFLLDRKAPLGGEVNLSCSISFDMYLEERFCLKLKLTKNILNPTATIVGNDDYTAWGYNWNGYLV